MKKKTLLVGVSAAFVLSTCSAMNGMGQMMVDAGQMMMDAGNGNAQTNMPQKVVTAETDVAQQVGGMVRVSNTVELVAGPVVVVDIFANRTTSTSVDTQVWLTTTTCALTPPAEAIDVGSFHAGRIFVPAGQKLCATVNVLSSSLNWAGFRPY